MIAEAYLAGMNTRRVRRALAKLFEGHVGKDVVSRAWQGTRSAWEVWQKRDLTDEDIVRLILDGTAVKVRLDRKATAISLLIALGMAGRAEEGRARESRTWAGRPKLPGCAETPPPCVLGRVDGWPTLELSPTDLDLAA